MRYLIALLFAIAITPAAFAQSGPWQLVVDGNPSTESPLTVSGQRLNVQLAKNFEQKSENKQANIYDETTGRFNAEKKDVLGIRFGFSYRITPGQTFAEFALFADVGTGIDPVKLGQWIEARPGVWRDVNPEVTIFAGDSVAANGVQLYFEAYGGSIDVAKFDVYTEIKHREEGLQVGVAEMSADIPLLSLTGVSDINWTIDTTSRLWTFDGVAMAYQGKPQFVDLRFNAKVFIGDAVNFQRPNYVAQIVRVNDGKVIAQAASTYIRDSNDHEEASWNIATLDPSPPPNPAYKVVYYRETASPVQIINVESEGASFSVIAY